MQIASCFSIEVVRAACPGGAEMGSCLSVFGAPHMSHNWRGDGVWLRAAGKLLARPGCAAEGEGANSMLFRFPPKCGMYVIFTTNI